ncbi:YceI family protein [Agriterribacter sp.]|uniref:YceI family protein n=1 Tax=Agriterribacter sp. TaxID=2821509 RepID=UPI002BF71750|nr:YceI family protein [Agriterribacter sp.]HRO46895.1 YceI family protein [Agriterribacter sp.]HRQ17389.1 YceI family protein [Agriterribacter sp.]
MANQTKWVLDPAHSEILFKVRHMMITNVKGEFRKFNATVLTEDDDFSKGTVEVTIEADSVFTNSTDRDTHLKSADFFDVENHKELKFTGISFTRLDEDNYLLKGLLNIKGIEKEVSFDVEFGGINKDPWGNMKAGFSLNGKINRKDWELNWNAALETGGVLVSDEVRITAEVQFVKEAA